MQVLFLFICVCVTWGGNIKLRGQFFAKSITYYYAAFRLLFALTFNKYRYYYF